MAEFTSHQPGTFTWPELATTDQNAGVAFYRALFGWDLNEQSMGPDGTYSMFLLRGKEVAAACSLRPDERQAGIPAHWNMYVTVDSADEAAAKAKQLGGKVLAPAFDVMNVGRMAVLQDPSGAVFEVWEPKLHIGAKILNEPGALCWSELTTRDAKAAEGVLHEAVWMDGEKQLRRRRRDAVHRVQHQGSARRRHAADARPDPGGRAVGTGCRTSRSPTPTPRRRKPPASAPR